MVQCQLRLQLPGHWDVIKVRVGGFLRVEQDPYWVHPLTALLLYRLYDFLDSLITLWSVVVGQAQQL